MNAERAPQGLPADAVFTFSQSSLQDYQDCPRRFQLRYVQDVQWPAVEVEPVAQAEGRQRDALLFHRLVQQHFLGLPEGALAEMAGSPDVARWWRNFGMGTPDLDGWQLYSEKALTCRVGSHRLISKYDLLAIRDGKAVIFDWKTHAHRPKNEWLAARMQTKVYRAMLVRAGAELNGGRRFAPGDVSMSYWFAEFPGEPAVFDYDERQHARAWEMLEGLVREIAAASNFPLTDDATACRFCSYRSLCDRGQRAGTGPEYEPEPSQDDSPGGEFEQIGEVQS